MTLLRNGIDLAGRLSSFISDSANLYIFAAYVKLEALKQLIDSANNCKVLVVRWELNDLVSGSSDLEVYYYCKEKNISLYRNPRLHVKAFVNDYKSCILGSANISARALNIPPSDHFNYEVATIVEDLSMDDGLYFNVILKESHLVTDDLYRQMEAEVEKRKIEMPDDADFEFIVEEKDFLISALPMSFDVATLLRVSSTRNPMNNIELNCALHDMALYDLPFNLSPEEAKERLKTSFFNQPFIQAFLSNVEVDGSVYFGRAKHWIHQNCADVPTPRKWELTENIQILYRWIVELGDGKFEVDIPGSHSERLRIN